MHKTIDLRGLTCPEPVLKTKALMDDASVLQVEALVDGEVNVNNLSRLGRSLKVDVSTEKLDGYFKVTLKRVEKNLAQNKKEETATYEKPRANVGISVGLVDNSSIEQADEKTARTAASHAHYPVASSAHISETKSDQVGEVVFLGKDKFGEGDAEFSTTLISLFLQTMFASGHRPRAILLANSGVRLMEKRSSSIKVLNNFKEAGVEVLACGLCVEFYKLKEEIPVEQITNMFAIVEYMFAADKVIAP